MNVNAQCLRHFRWASYRNGRGALIRTGAKAIALVSFGIAPAQAYAMCNSSVRIASEAASAPEPVVTEEELASLPPVEALTANSDICAFLRPGIPAALKNAAMRKMWMLTPAIRDHKDIAVDYAWDWSTPGGMSGDGGALDPVRVAKMLRELPAPDPVSE